MLEVLDLCGGMRSQSVFVISDFKGFLFSNLIILKNYDCIFVLFFNLDKLYPCVV